MQRIRLHVFPVLHEGHPLHLVQQAGDHVKIVNLTHFQVRKEAKLAKTVMWGRAHVVKLVRCSAQHA